MEFINEIVNYFYTPVQPEFNIDIEEDSNKYDDVIESIELIDYNEPKNIIQQYKYNNVSQIIQTNIITNLDIPTSLYNENGILNINKTRNYYKSFISTYYNDIYNPVIRTNIFTDFYILNIDKDNIKSFNQD